HGGTGDIVERLQRRRDGVLPLALGQLLRRIGAVAGRTTLVAAGAAAGVRVAVVTPQVLEGRGLRPGAGLVTVAPQRVDRQVADDPAEPRAEARGLLEVGQPLPRADEGLLHDVARSGSVGQDAERNR